MSGIASLRLFFALWPDQATRNALHRLTRSVALSAGGRPVPARNLHLTLAFLGNVPAAELDAIAGAAGRIVPARAALRLDRLGYWPGSRVLWLGPSQPPAAVDQLARDLRAAMTELGVYRVRGSFRPHVTLARKVMQAPAGTGISTIRWRVQDFVLVKSQTSPAGSSYSVIRRFS